MKSPLLLDSINEAAALPESDRSSSHAESDHRIVVSGSHGGLYPAAIASRAGFYSVVFNDASIGFEQAGVAGVLQLDEVGMAAATADANTCKIGSAKSSLQRGVISVANNTAASLGVETGMKVSEATALLQHAPAPRDVLAAPAESMKFRTIDANDARVVLLDSASMINSSHIDQWVVTGSHGGLLGGDPNRALKAAAALVVFNDAGKGLNETGITRLPVLAERGIAAVTVDCNLAMIGDAKSTFENGSLSAINRVAEHKGASCGAKLIDWLSTLPPPANYTLTQMDENWHAVHQATLLFVLDGTNVLLIRKKRGLGAGKINGPGGKLDPGETPEQCAVREVEEELMITPADIQSRGELRFQFSDGYSIHVHVFIAYNYSGIPQETEEAVPLWFPVQEIPYDEMWEDDRIWLPEVMNGLMVNGRFTFEEDRMLEHEVNFTARKSNLQKF